MKEAIQKFIHHLYIPPFNRLTPYHTFRYLACGGGNMVFDLSFYAILYNFVFDKENIDIGFIVISPYIAAFLIVFPITFLTGFWLMNNIAFEGSPMRNRTKLCRYFIVVCVSILINYAGLKLFIEYLCFYPTPAKLIVTIISTMVSYVSQRSFTFRHFKR